MQYRKLDIIKLLTILLVGFLFLMLLSFTSEAYAESDSSNNIDALVNYNGHSWQYNLWENSQGLTMQQLANRGVGANMAVKHSVVNNLIAKGYSSAEAHNYVLPNFASWVESIDKVVFVAKVDSVATFSPNSSNKFSYSVSTDGIKVDSSKLAELLIDSTGRSRVEIELPTIIDFAVSPQFLRENTVVIGKFTTKYGNRVNRVTNIKRASNLVSGSIVPSGGRFSFNNVVGERSLSNGFVNATVISEGKYTDGVGGGVCQASTTLYNCALLSLMRIDRVCQHSLVPAYIEPSFDAMVSYPNADLVFTNTSSMPVYIAMYATDSSVTAVIYGKPHNCTVERTSCSERTSFTTNYITDRAKYPELVYADDTKVLVSGSDGVDSKGYLVVSRGGKVVSNTLIRTNKYKLVDRVVARGECERTTEEDSGEWYNCAVMLVLSASTSYCKGKQT